MSDYFLAPGVHICTIDGGAIFLSLRANQYTAIDPEYMPTIERGVEGVATLCRNNPADEIVDTKKSHELIHSLVTRGLLTQSKSHGRSAAPLELSTMRAIPNGLRRRSRIMIRAVHVTHFILSIMYVSLLLRQSRLEQIISRLRRLKAMNTSSESHHHFEDIVEILAVYRRLRTFAYTAHNACLFDSLVMSEFLHRLHINSTFVIGVRTKPFLAHAWVQIDDCVLDETVERVQALTPILVV